MPFFAVPYDIHFDDTMAYGSHHFLTNFKFQCAGREHLLFGENVFGTEGFREAFERVALLTHEAYSRNLAPAFLGDRLVVLTSLEERGAIGARFCFRTLRADGEPIAAGFQTILCAERSSGELSPFPPAFARSFEQHDLTEAIPGFRERVLAGGSGIGVLFPPALRELARSLRGGASAFSGARFVSVPLPAPAVASSSAPKPAPPPLLVPDKADLPALADGAVLFVHPGQGTFDSELYARLVADLPEPNELRRALEAARPSFGSAVEALLLTDATAITRALSQEPNLDQLGIYLTGVLGAQRLEREGVVANVHLGHSLGEIAALAAGGGFDLETGVRVVCARVAALTQAGSGLGTLAAVGVRAEELAPWLGNELVVAGRNHPKQTVVAGPRAALAALQECLAAEGKALTFVPSRWPFHHPALGPARAAFQSLLAGVAWRAPRVPVFSAIEHRYYGAEDFGDVLSSHLTRPFDFQSAVERLYRAGVRRFVEAGTGRLARIVAKSVPAGAQIEALSQWLERAQPAAAPTPAEQPLPSPDPGAIAVVAMGCVFPGGASDPDRYWDHVRRGIGGIVDLGASPDLADDFLSPLAGGVVSDRTYSLLTGAVHDADLSCPPGLEPARFANWSRTQQLAAVALEQLVRAAPGLSALPGSRLRCFVGSTAEGSGAYDEATMLAADEALLRELGGGDAEISQHREAARRAFGPQALDAAGMSPHAAIADVVTTLVGPAVDTVLLDAACASALYGIALGVEKLRRGDADAVLAGGVFCPSLANSCLFAQFRGLSATGSRPFDRSADGVIFGEGAGFVALKRLEDALRDGDRIRAVIRSVGLSSDGRSSSANVPQVAGQVAAIERCYAGSGIDAASVQFVEAHGTATPAGDATEIAALSRAFAGRRKEPIELGSVKALLGHTGWTAGTASVIKLVMALESRIVPRQPCFSEPCAALVEAGATFRVPTAEAAWPENGALPRRAATSGFGFGGTNAHLVLEAFEPEYHRALAARAPAAPARTAATQLVVVGVGEAFPSDGGKLTQSRLLASPSARILPDIVDDMDASQALAIATCQAAVAGLGEGFKQLRDRTAIVMALPGKTPRSLEATWRISSTRRVRKLEQTGATSALLSRLAEAVRARTRASGAYTLQGMMANVAPGRAASVLDVHGPNFVVDTGEGSLGAALELAETLLEGELALVLVGALHVAAAGVGGDEGALTLALTTAEKAALLGLPVVAPLSLARSSSVAEPCVASTSRALLAAIRAPQNGHAPRLELRLEPRSGRSLIVRVGMDPGTPAHSPEPEPEERVSFYHPVLVERSVRPRARSWAERRVLVLVEEMSAGKTLTRWASETARDFCVLSLAAGGELESSVSAALEAFEPDVVVAVCLLDPNLPEPTAVTDVTRRTRLLEGLFVACRRLYPRLKAGSVDALALCVGGATDGERLHPATGLFSGFLKSLGREVGARRVRSVSTSAMPLEQALAHLVTESPADDDGIEVIWRDGQRFGRALRRTPAPSAAGGALGPDSVVVASGGARGVTAVLMEALLRRHACTVVLLGRTDWNAVPPEILRAEPAELDALETAFYAAERRRDANLRLPELRRRFAEYRAAHEAHAAFERMAALPGRVLYRAVDVTNGPRVSALIDEVLATFGRLDLVVHGAGTQTSKTLDKRTLGELRQNLAAKLTGIEHLSHAAARAPRPVAVHVLTSAFSYIGNDGQADYGAANEALDRLCAWMAPNELSKRWTSIGWLAWDGVGMTRGSEYRTLGSSRGLHGVGVEEGGRLFLALLDGKPQHAINVQLTAGERAYYGIEILPEARRVEVSVDLDAACVTDHLVRGAATVPGAWALDAMLGAVDARRDLPLLVVENAWFTRFLKRGAGALPKLRAVADVHDAPNRWSATVRLIGDLVHASGRVLEPDAVWAEASFVRTAGSPSGDFSPEPTAAATEASDPYCANAAIALRGPFACLEDIRLGPDTRSARFRVRTPNTGTHLPALLLDASWRLSAMHIQGPSPDVYVPIRLARAVIDTALVGANDLCLRSTAPRRSGEEVLCGSVRVLDPEGRLRMMIDGSVARAFS